MKHTAFVEAMSADPFVRDLHRKAIRILNDPSLDRQQREVHIRRLQSRLVEHQAIEVARAQKMETTKAKREPGSRAQSGQPVADQSQVLARRKEFGVLAREEAVPVPEAMAPAAAVKADGNATGHTRPLLTLRRA